MSETKFFGARIDVGDFEIINKVSEEENIDKTSAVRLLIKKGWKEYKIEKALHDYREGKISIDKAADMAGLIVHDMMSEAIAKNIRADESMIEMKKGVRFLLGK
jgi:predicted HTH domain antitoxin